MESQKIKFDKIRADMASFLGEKKPLNLEDILFLVGLEYLGNKKQKYSAQQKMEIIHMGVCSLLESYGGFYKFKHKDEQGWAHFEKVKSIPENISSEDLLVEAIINRFS